MSSQQQDEEVTVTASREDWETLKGFVQHELFLTEGAQPSDVVESVDRVCSEIYDALPDDRGDEQ